MSLGDAKDVVDTDVYDPRVRGWYQDAMAKCTNDLLNVYTCGLHWTAPFVFKSDGSLGITPAIGFLDSTTGLPLGVTAYGFKLSQITTLLSDAVQANPDMTAYIMEGDGNLLGVSNDAAVTINDERVNARDSTDAAIAKSAKLVIDDHYRSDQTILVDGELITVKGFEKDDQLRWYIVIIEPYDGSDSGDEVDCILELESNILQITHGELDLFLTNIIEAGDLTADALRLGLVPSYTPPTVIDEAFGIQDYLWAIIRNCDVTRMLYIGYEDGTSISFDREGLVSSFRGGDSSGDTTRYYYHIDSMTGEKTTAAFKTKVYDARTRPWYTHGEQIGYGSFSPIFTFATGGQLGITYSVPFYENGVFKGVVGADFMLDEIEKILAKQHEPGFGLFIFENERTSADDAYDMVGSSDHVIIANSTRQHKAYDNYQVESYYVSTVAQYLQDNGLVHDLDVVTLEDMTAEILNYDARTLHWRIAAYNVNINAADATLSSSSDTDDELDTVLEVASASLGLLVILLILVVLAVFFAKKGADVAGGTSSGSPGGTTVTQNPLAVNEKDGNPL